MKRKTLIVLFAILLIALSVTCFAACKPTVNEKDPKVCYSEIQDCLKSIGERYGSCNGYTYETQSTFDGNTSRARVRETRQPVYYESWEYLPDDWLFTPKNDLQSLVREENGQVVAYVNERNNYYKRTVLGAFDDYEKPSKIFPTIYVWDEITLDVNKCDIAYKNGAYTIVVHYDDFKMGNFKDLLEFLLENDEKEALSKAVVTIGITATENKTTVSFAATLKVNTDGKADERDIELTWSIDFAEFEQTDFDNGNYNVLHAKSIEEVYGLTDISKPLTCDAHDNVFKVELEQGLYYIKHEHKPYVTIRSADDINNILELGILDERVTDLNDDYNYCFNVEKSGQYYIIFEYCENETYEIVRCPYDDLYDVNNPKSLQENVTGIIEGKYDLECYSYTNEREGLLSITNTSNTAIDIICKVLAHNSYRQLTLPAGETLENLPVVDGGITLFVCKPDATQSVNYSLTTSFYQNDNGISMDFDEMPWITTEFSDDYYAVGYGLSSKFVRMHVDTKGVYAFEFESLYEGLSNDWRVSVYDANSRQSVDYKYNALEAGDYIVILNNSFVELSIAKVKYVLIKTAENLETTITLNKISIAEKDSEKVRVYPITDIENQEVKYRFTLDEESVVLYGPYICLFDANDKPLSLGSLSLGAIKLGAGEYYFSPYIRFGSYHTIAILVDYNGSVIDYGNMPVLTTENPIMFETNDLKVAYFEIQIEHAGRYYFDDADVYVYDEGLNGIARVPYSRCYDLAEGTYYAMIELGWSNAVMTLTEVSQ